MAAALVLSAAFASLAWGTYDTPKGREPSK